MENHKSTFICGFNSSISLDKYNFLWYVDRTNNLLLQNENDNDLPSINLFYKFTVLNDIKMISCGKYHIICLNYSNEVYSFGYNNKNQLGIGISSDSLMQSTIPQKINLPPIIYISCGKFFTICLTEDKYLYSFGRTDYGELGLGNDIINNDIILTPQQIPNISDVIVFDCGFYHTICKTKNNLYSWGKNYSQLAQNTTNTICHPAIIPTNINDSIISIKCGMFHNLLLTKEGQVYSFGDNENGQLGFKWNTYLLYEPTLIKDIPEIQRIECGYEHSMCIDINNNLWVFGYNGYGQLGLGDKKTNHIPLHHPTLSNIIDISSGGNHTFVKTIDNKIYAFGNNKYSQLGIQTSEEIQLTPIQVFKDNEDIWCSTIGKSKQKSARK